MSDLLQTILIAVTVGSLYALIALGYTMVYGILKLINFAHGDIVVLGAWTSYTLAVWLLPTLGINPLAAPWWVGPLVLLASMLLCGGAGFLIERLAYRPLRGAPRLNILITAIGISLLLQNAGQLRYEVIPPDDEVASGTVQPGAGPSQVRLSTAVTIEQGRAYRIALTPAESTTATFADVTAPPGRYEAGADLALGRKLGKAQTRDATFSLRQARVPLYLPFGPTPAAIPPLVGDRNVFEFRPGAASRPLSLGTADAVIIATAALLLVGLELLVYRTNLGLAMRAVSFNTVNAGLMGVPVNRVISFTFVLGSCLAAAAGFLYAMKYHQIQQPAHGTWVLLGLKAFVAAVVGGIGNIRGAVLGGFLIAFLEQFGARYVSPAMTDVYVFALLILILLVKPSGLLGSAVKEKV